MANCLLTMLPFRNDSTSRRSIRLAVTLTVNLIPLAGLLFLHWSVFEIALLYWFECVLIGIAEIFGILVKGPKPGTLDPINRAIERSAGSVIRTFHYLRKGITVLVSTLLTLVVTLLVYGICAAMYGMAIVQFLSDVRLRVPEWSVEHPMVAGLIGIGDYLFSTNLKWAAIAMVFNQLWSLGSRFLSNRASSGSGKEDGLDNPSPFLIRVIFLHLAIAAGAFVIHLFGSPFPLVVLLLLGKTAMEFLMLRGGLEESG